MLTNGQKQALHSAARRMGPEFTEDLRRTVQWNVGGFYSSADKTATRQGFIACMAFYEDRLAEHGHQLALTPTYWRDELAKSTPGDALKFRVRSQAARMGWSQEALDQWLAGPHMARQPGLTVGTATPYWLWRAASALGVMLKRQTA